MSIHWCTASIAPGRFPFSSSDIYTRLLLLLLFVNELGAFPLQGSFEVTLLLRSTVFIQRFLRKSSQTIWCSELLFYVAIPWWDEWLRTKQPSWVLKALPSATRHCQVLQESGGKSALLWEGIILTSPIPLESITTTYISIRYLYIFIFPLWIAFTTSEDSSRKININKLFSLSLSFFKYWVHLLFYYLK